LQIRQGTAKGFHPGRTAELFVAIAGEAVSIGFAGELDPSLTQAQDLPRSVAALELNLETLYSAAPDVIRAGALLTMPAATQDLSLVVDAQLNAAELQATILEGAGELLESIRLVDDYRGEALGAGKKSLTFALRFRAADRTLTQAEASEKRDAAVALAASRHGAELRA